MVHVNPINKASCLEWLCESNYRKLLKLIPELLSLNKSAVGKASKNPDLQLDIIERAPHTLTIQLSHCFGGAPDDLMTPEVKVRVYLDAQLAEVLRDCVRSDVSSVFKDPGHAIEILDYKWRLNYFLEKWLDHCLQKNYQFQVKTQEKEVFA
ncbi:MAG: DUF1249 domain-containing protein [Gammaproteobacteria bacterium]